MNTKINSLSDAKTYVDNSGVVDWEWDHETYEDDEIVDELLPKYIWQNVDNHITKNEYDEPEFDFDSCLKVFIKDVLKQDPKDYCL